MKCLIYPQTGAWKHSQASLLIMLSLIISSPQSKAIPGGIKPNVVIINVDDLGYGDLGCYGATRVRTPHIDQLAREGRRFTDFHTVSAVCSPSRYALITGQYPSRKNQWGALFLRNPLVVDTNQLTIADVMRHAGYSTAIIGKWHLGFGNKFPVDWNQPLTPGPLELGFEYYFGVPVLNSHAPFVYVENHHVVGFEASDPFVYGERPLTDSFPEKFDMKVIGGAAKAHSLYKDRMVGTTLVEKAIDWIRNQKGNPFFLYLATTNIHHPFTPAERFIGTSEAGRYGDFIHELDWIVGEVIETLDKEGLAQNTLLILTSDNGGMLNQGGQEAWEKGHRLNGNLLGFKFGAWEGGHRVPFIARWPGKIPAGTESSALMGNVDLLATLAALVGYELKENEGPDSFNGLPVLLGEPGKPIRESLVIHPNQKNNIAIRKGKWMFISAQNSGGFTGTRIGDHDLGGAAANRLTGQVNSDIKDGEIKPGAPPAQLYDLESDPFQRENVYNRFPKIVRELRSLLNFTLIQRGSSRP